MKIENMQDLLNCLGDIHYCLSQMNHRPVLPAVPTEITDEATEKKMIEKEPGGMRLTEKGFSFWDHDSFDDRVEWHNITCERY